MSSFNFLVAVTIALVLFGKGDAIPDIKIQGVKKKIENGASVHQLMCSTNNVFDGCTVEFLLNRKTIESIRYVNKTCYNGGGVCYSLQCACSDGCDAFTFNYTKGVEKEHQIFECDTRIKDNHIFYRANASGSFIEDDFVEIDKTVTIMSETPSPSKKVPTKTVLTDASFPKERQICISDDQHETVIALSSLVGLNFIINCFLLGVVLWMCLCQNKPKRRGTSIDKDLKRRAGRKQYRKTSSDTPDKSTKSFKRRLTGNDERSQWKNRQRSANTQLNTEDETFDTDNTTSTEQAYNIYGRTGIHDKDLYYNIESDDESM